MSTMPYQPPRHVLEVLQRIEYEAPLTADDPRYVDTREARGSQRTLDRLARKFGLLLSTGDFLPPTKKHVLFFGHTGSGKTTELRRYARDLNGAQRFLVVEVDIGATLDHNNLQYADTLMAMARSLLGALDAAGVHPRSSALAELENWFNERVLSSEEGREFRAEVETGVQAKTGLPFLAELFARFTAAFRTNVAYKDSLRRVIRNSFSQFAEAFNTLLRDGEEALVAAGKGRRVLFMIDGTDKLRSEDRLRFFVHDAEQLLAIDAHVVYTAPLSLKYEGNLTNRLDADLVLPMIKLGERDGSRCAAGTRAVKDILLKRADRSLFASECEIERLVEHCGGHPRELLKLLKLCCEFADEDSIDARTVEQAIAQLASEYRRFLEPDDYRLLAQLDRDAIHAGNDERTRRLLYHLALLEYNDGAWRRSHPVVRTLEGYRLAAAEQPPQRGAL